MKNPRGNTISVEEEEADDEAEEEQHEELEEADMDDDEKEVLAPLTFFRSSRLTRTNAATCNAEHSFFTHAIVSP